MGRILRGAGVLLIVGGLAVISLPYGGRQPAALTRDVHVPVRCRPPMLGAFMQDDSGGWFAYAPTQGPWLVPRRWLAPIGPEGGWLSASARGSWA